ncbi:hypothetical protein CEP52_009633 [Fusarium oligoseptatum]|uniref:Uncharacterized protein n=1 Tax=Fusarium oligoseptatum TaxID=2604345 RepID=A0A428TC56_9HYPO|nr:hypothetical protein CEP52_009633 [Fusarium oligoseptatum]
MESKPASPSAWHHFLRATGLRVFEALFSDLFGQVEWLDYEPPKPIFYNSWGSVFARLGVHILPILASVTIISLNLCTLYLGSGGLPGPLIDFSITSAMLQVVAKLQELLIVASLTSVVFSVIRDQLVSTMGVPLGLLSVGFMFSHLSFFWSMEFWGALRSQLPLSTTILTALLLAAAGIISATAGPSVAVLLVPRYHDWDAGGSDFFLRGTVDQIFPDRLTNITTSPSRDEILTSLCLSPNATNSALCPSAGFLSLMSHVVSLPKLENGFDKGPTPRVIHGPFGWYSVTVDSNLVARDRSTGLDSNAFQSILENSDILDQHLNNADNPTETWNDDKDGSLNRTLYLEWITALVIASGISRHGIDGALNMTGDVRSWTLLDYSKRPDFNKRLVAGKTALQQPNGTEFTSFFTSISINGLAYKANSITDYLAITVLLAHIVLVLGHSVYVVYTRRSSDAWDSVMEMLILAHNSQPTSYALRNTSAGLKMQMRKSLCNLMVVWNL